MMGVIVLPPPSPHQQLQGQRTSVGIGLIIEVFIVHIFVKQNFALKTG